MQSAPAASIRSLAFGLVAFRQNRDRLTIKMMAASSDSLGVLLATVSEPGELDDPGSLSSRIAPGEADAEPVPPEYSIAWSDLPFRL